MKNVRARQGIVALAVVVLAVALAVPAGAASTKPSAPRAVHATATASAIKVSWHAPASKGGGPITSYHVTSRPGAKQCSTKGLTCTVAGLKKGTAYAFVVTAKNRYGTSPSSALSNHATIALPPISIGDAGAQFIDQDLAETTAFNTFFTSFDAATSAADVATATTTMQASIATVVSTLTADRWPSGVEVLVGDYTGELTTVATDLANWGQAAFGTDAAFSAATATLYEDQNALLEFDELVRVPLQLANVIYVPSDKTTTTANLGTAQTVDDIYGDAFSITVSSVVDPATPAAGSGAADPGYRFVDVQLSITDPPSTQEVSSDANNDVTVIGSDGNTYTADFGTLNGCSNFNYGTYDLAPNDSTTGCVAFQVPTGVTVATVAVNLQPGLLATADWTN